MFRFPIPEASSKLVRIKKKRRQVKSKGKEKEEPVAKKQKVTGKASGDRVEIVINSKGHRNRKRHVYDILDDPSALSTRAGRQRYVEQARSEILSTRKWKTEFPVGKRNTLRDLVFAVDPSLLDDFFRTEMEAWGMTVEAGSSTGAGTVEGEAAEGFDDEESEIDDSMEDEEDIQLTSDEDGEGV